MEKVGKYMTHEVFVLNPNYSLAKARNVMLTKKIGKLLIVDEKEKVLDKNHRLKGIFSMREVLKVIAR